MTENMEFQGKVAIVTGAGRGMGRAVAMRLAAGGATIAVNDLRTDDAQRVADELNATGTEALAVAGDVTDSGDVRRMVSQDDGMRFGAVHILINNAGVLRPTAGNRHRRSRVGLRSWVST